MSVEYELKYAAYAFSIGKAKVMARNPKIEEKTAEIINIVV